MSFAAKKIVWGLACLFFLCACTGDLTPERARAEIDKRGVPFDEEGILSAVGTADNELLRLFLAAGFDPNRRSETGPATLELASARANLAAVKMLIKAGASAADLPGILNSPASRDDIATIELLLEAGADIDSVDHLKRSALVAALNRGRIYAVRFLLENGADPSGNRRGGSPLHESIRLDLFEATELLVAGGANVNAVNGSPLHTPLTLAATQGLSATVDLLLANGADPSRAVARMTPAHAARRGGHEALAERLEKAVAN